MRVFLLMILLLFSTNLIHGQEIEDTSYFNSNWEEVNKDNYTYYRILKKKGDLYHVTDYWKTGEVQMTGTYESMEPETKHGDFNWYYKNGNQKQHSYFQEGRVVGLISKYDKNGALSFNFTTEIDHLDNANEVKRHIRKFHRYISKNIQYPTFCYEHRLEGKVIVDFFINLNGNVFKTSVVESPHPCFIDEAIRIIISYDDWPSPVFKGENTNLHLTVPIIFDL